MSIPSRFHSSVPRPRMLHAASLAAALLMVLALMIPARSIHAQTSSGQVVSWVHIGDLHMVDTSLSNYNDLKTIVSDINSYMKDGVNFTYLPGDNANDGAESEYQLVHGVVQNLQVPLKAVPGDHDKKGPSANFLTYIYPKMPDSFDIGNYHFVLYDSFNLQNVLPWLTSDLNAAKATGKQSVIFQHEYDINSCCSALQSLIQNDNVILVDTGHTHTNVLANDGHTVYAATRSTGQATEGPVGFSLESLDHGIVSWHFQPLGQWPFVSITSPADQGLLINRDQIVKGTTTIHVKAFSNAAITSVSYQIDGGTKVPMSDRGGSLWSGSWNSTGVSDGAHTIDVTVTDANGKTTADEIKALVNQSGAHTVSTKSFGPETNTLPINTSKGLLGGSRAGGAKGGGKAKGSGKAKGGPGRAACTTATATTPTPTATPATTSTTTPKGGHRKAHGNCGAKGTGTRGGKGGKGARGGGKHGPKGHAPCATSSTGTPSPTMTPITTPGASQKGGHGKGHAGCAAAGAGTAGAKGGKGSGKSGKKGGGKHGSKGTKATSRGVSAVGTPTETAVTP